jgi:hypothetical protein
MQSIDLQNPEMPDLQFVLMVAALCTADLPTLNAPASVRQLVFDRCWVLIHEGAPPATQKERVLDLRYSTEDTLEPLVLTIRQTFEEADITRLEWDHPPSEPTQASTPAAQPLVERLRALYPEPPDIVDPPAAF